ncbi:MAG: hypothetical protein GC159_13770 [Phycisphaera sp.]|nr:hypothetical protein [Phycisphaera sp.]
MEPIDEPEHEELPEAVKRLIRAFDDPERIGLTADGERYVDSSVFKTACHRLAANPSAASVATLARFIYHNNDSIYQTAIECLVATGHDAAIPHIVSLLADEQRSRYAVWGVSRAVEADRVTPRYRQEVFDALITELFRSDRSDTPAKAMLALDRERAFEILTADKVLRLDFPGLLDVLLRLNAERIELPRERLLKLTDELLEMGDPGRLEVCAEYILLALGRHCGADVEDRLRRAMDHPCLSDGAVWGWCAYCGIEGPYEIAIMRMRTVGWKAMTKTEQHVFNVAYMADLVWSGGLDGYFENTEGEHPRSALESLKVIDAPVAVSLLKQAIKKAGRFRRYDRLSNMEFDGAENVGVLIARYAAEHVDDMTPRDRAEREYEAVRRRGAD